MTVRYLRSTDGADTDDGSTWALAKATTHTASTGMAATAAAGDRVWISQANNQETAGAASSAWAATLASPVQIWCGNDGTEPPTAVVTTPTAQISTTSAGSLTWTGCFDARGIIFSAGATGGTAGSGSVSIFMGTANDAMRRYLKNNKFYINTTNTSSTIRFAGESEMDSCEFNFHNAGQRVLLLDGTHHWRGITAGTDANPSAFVGANSAGTRLLCENFDFSNWGSTLALVSTTGIVSACEFVFRNGTMPTGWVASGALTTATLAVPGVVVRAYNCRDDTVNCDWWFADYYGQSRAETTTYQSSAGGSTDGTTPWSVKMVSTSAAVFPDAWLKVLEPYAIWNDTVGSAVTLTFNVATDNVTLKDIDFGVRVEYPSSSSFPVYASAGGINTDPLAQGSNLTTSTATWTGVPGTPVKQKVAVTFTPQMAGWLLITPVLARASTTVYVNVKPEIS